nr:Glycosyl transferase, family 14 [Ipomoea batatas]
MKPRGSTNNGTLEEGNDTSLKPATQSRPLPLKLLQFLLTFLGLGCVFSVISMYTVEHFKTQQLVTPKGGTWLHTCSREIGGLEDWILPPSNLAHNLNDTELFWRATFVPRITRYPFSRKPKIAFMYLTMGSLPLAPLWERFFNGSEGLYSIYIHSLPSYTPDYKPSSVFYNRQIPSQWGTMNMCDAERRLLANALLDQSNEWFVLLSESCIPLHNFTTVYNYISRSQHSFVGVFDDPGPVGRGRYNGNMAPEITIAQWRKGSQWFEVDRKLAVEIVRDNVYYPKFEQFCRPACYSDEHYIPTMLSIQFPSLLANRPLTWTDWSRGGSHPATFGEADAQATAVKRRIEIGPWGGHGGSSWDDGSHDGIREISLVYGRCIDSIRAVYDRNGRPFSAEKHGGNGGDKTGEVKLQFPEEYLTSISGYYGPQRGSLVVRSLTFKSNQRTFGPFGLEEGTPFSLPMEGGKIVGFKGRGGWYVDSIGCYIARIQTPNAYQKVQKTLKKLTSTVAGDPNRHRSSKAAAP